MANRYTIIFFTSLTLITTLNILHYNFTLYINKEENIQLFVDTTKLPGIVRGVSFVESRFVEYKDYGNTLATDLKEIDYLGFVYDK